MNKLMVEKVTKWQLSLKISKDEIRENEKRWWDIYRAKEHRKRSDTFV